jgi:hypothetical protein
VGSASQASHAHVTRVIVVQRGDAFETLGQIDLQVKVAVLLLDGVVATVLYVQKRDGNGASGMEGGKCTRDTEEQGDGGGKRVGRVKNSVASGLAARTALPPQRITIWGFSGEQIEAGSRQAAWKHPHFWEATALVGCV